MSDMKIREVHSKIDPPWDNRVMSDFGIDDGTREVACCTSREDAERIIHAFEVVDLALAWRDLLVAGEDPEYEAAQVALIEALEAVKPAPGSMPR